MSVLVLGHGFVFGTDKSCSFKEEKEIRSHTMLREVLIGPVAIDPDVGIQAELWVKIPCG